jgi:hypothetical protein
MSRALLAYEWNGEAMVPLRRFARQADKMFVVGETYVLTEEMGRSDVSHRHEFAWLRDAWLSLPEGVGAEFPTAEALRKRALIATGWANARQFVAATPEDAARMAAWIVPRDEYAIVTVDGCVVTELTAMSQRKKAMGNDDFQASKTAVLEYVAGLLGCTTDELRAA